MKKICFVTTVNITVKAFLLKQIEALSKENFDITIVCDKASELRELVNPNVKLCDVAFKRGVDFVGLISHVYTLYHLFTREKYDIVNYLTPNASFYSSIACKLAHVENTIYSQCGLRYQGFKNLSYVIFNFIERITCFLSKEIQPVSFSMRDYCINKKFYDSNKSNVIANGSSCGVNLEIFNYKKKREWKDEFIKKYDIENNDLIIGFVGRVTKDKGIVELLESSSSFLDEKTKLVIVGPIEDKSLLNNEEIYKIIKKNNIIFTGSVDYIEKYFAAFDIFILPSYREGFGNVSIEAQAMKVPCIVTNIIGLRDTIIPNKTGLLIEKDNTEDLIKAVNALKKNPILRRTMGENGYKYIKQRFNENDVINEFVKDKKRKVDIYGYK